MKLCILCPDEHVEKARENIKSISELKNIKVLTIPASETGEMPITHWFCYFNSCKKVQNEIMQISKYSTIEACQMSDFLKSKKLKLINKRKINRGK